MTKIAWTMVRKGKRRFLLRRRALALTDESTRKYIHTSAEYTTLISGIGFEGIDAYLRTTRSHVYSLREMCNTGTIDTVSLASDIESMTAEVATIIDDLAHIKNSVIRFIHTDRDKERNTRYFRDRIRGIRTPCRCDVPDEETALAPAPLIPLREGQAAIGCDVHD